MNIQRFVPGARILRGGLAVVLLAALAACSSTSKPKPAELPANTAVMGVRQAWNMRKVPNVSFALVANTSAAMWSRSRADDGTVVAIDARNGVEMWRANAGAPLTAGVGSDGSLAAVVTANNDVVALQGGKVLWKQRLTAQAYTPPLVAGRRIFVQAADRTTSAWDGQSGRRLWSQTRTAENLVLSGSARA